MEYSILGADYELDLIDAVNKAIGEGFEPVGGVSVLRYEVDDVGYWYYAQAVIKRDAL